MTHSLTARSGAGFVESATTVPAEPTGATTAAATTNSGLTTSDEALLNDAIKMERALEELYGFGGDDEIMQQLMSSHQSFATRLAGIAGTASTERDDQLVATNKAAFTSKTASAALTLENKAVANYLDWVAGASDQRIVAAFAAIASGTSRHAVLLGWTPEQAKGLQ